MLSNIVRHLLSRFLVLDSCVLFKLIELNKIKLVVIISDIKICR